MWNNRRTLKKGWVRRIAKIAVIRRMGKGELSYLVEIRKL